MRGFRRNWAVRLFFIQEEKEDFRLYAAYPNWDFEGYGHVEVVTGELKRFRPFEENPKDLKGFGAFELLNSLFLKALEGCVSKRA